MRFPPKPNSIGRIPSRGLISGVCAGIAAKLNMKVTGVRILYCALLFVTGFFPLIALYLILTLVLPVHTPERWSAHDSEPNRPYDDLLARSYKKKKQIRSLFASNEKRLSKLESWIISSEYEWERKYRGL